MTDFEICSAVFRVLKRKNSTKGYDAITIAEYLTDMGIVDMVLAPSPDSIMGAVKREIKGADKAFFRVKENRISLTPFGRSFDVFCTPSQTSLTSSSIDYQRAIFASRVKLWKSRLDKCNSSSVDIEDAVALPLLCLLGYDIYNPSVCTASKVHTGVEDIPEYVVSINGEKKLRVLCLDDPEAIIAILSSAELIKDVEATLIVSSTRAVLWRAVKTPEDDDMMELHSAEPITEFKFDKLTLASANNLFNISAFAFNVNSIKADYVNITGITQWFYANAKKPSHALVSFVMDEVGLERTTRNYNRCAQVLRELLNEA